MNNRDFLQIRTLDDINTYKRNLRKELSTHRQMLIKDWETLKTQGEYVLTFRRHISDLLSIFRFGPLRFFRLGVGVTRFFIRWFRH